MYMFDLRLALQSVLKSADCSADSYPRCTFKCIIQMGDLLKIRLAWLLIAQLVSGCMVLFEVGN